jgi:glycogen operon protein
VAVPAEHNSKNDEEPAVADLYKTRPGRRYPAGANVEEEGVNFSVFSRHATSAELLLYEGCESDRPFQVIQLDPETNHTFFTWHVMVEDLPPGTQYTWRMDGPRDTQGGGFRFDPRQELLDPWARGVCDNRWDRWRAIQEGPIPHEGMRAVVVADDDYDWEGDEPLRVPSERMVIYELHVGGFTRHPSSGVSSRGTFAGVIEKIPYLKSLGITHVELMPVMAFDEQDVPPQVASHGLGNFWGYSTHSFFSPHPSYCISPQRGTHRIEFRDMVKALHKAGIGVILDVVFNHTAEGGAGGPHINFQGFANETFYHLDGLDRRIYRDYTGCGNTVNANHPFVARFIIDCLEYWVREMHVDGFRFDLASAMARGEDGHPMHNPPVLWGIELSDFLSGTKIIAEAWDAAGLYQVGTFPGYRWSEWNGRYRDTVRRFVRGDAGLAGEVATRIAGSSDLYQANWRLPINSVNFVCCHDGFTLWDLVSYDHKHNKSNFEGNRDGSPENLSWNCGVEGPTDDPEVLQLRRRQARNFMAILLLSEGIPMLLAGDEMLRTQKGNNNAWCQDNELGWIDWGLLESNADMVRFVREMIALRKRHPALQRRRFFSGHQAKGARFPDIQWHGVKLGVPPWDQPGARCLAFTLGETTPGEEPMHVMINMGETSRSFEVPVLDDLKWRRAVDTHLPSPEDIVEVAAQTSVPESHYRVAPRTLVVLEGR